MVKSRACPRSVQAYAIARLILPVAAMVVISGCVSSSERGGSSGVTIRYATITSVQRVALPSAEPADAVVGGFTGLALSKRSSKPRQQVSGTSDAALGGLATGALGGERLGYAYRLRFFDGSELNYITEKSYLRVDDCVAVESGTYKNLRRVASAVCDAGLQPRAPITMHQSNAAECQRAKSQLLIAQGPDQEGRAAREVEIACHF